MTNAEAVEILKSRRMCAAYVDSEYVDSVDIEAIDMAISALEKQEGKKPLTNADRIRVMTDEELAKLILPVPCPPIRYHMDEFGARYTECPNEERIHGCCSCWLDWLKQEVKDNA